MNKRELIATVIVFFAILGVLSIPLIFLHIDRQDLFYFLVGFIAGIGATDIIYRLLDEMC